MLSVCQQQVETRHCSACSDTDNEPIADSADITHDTHTYGSEVSRDFSRKSTIIAHSAWAPSIPIAQWH